MNQDHLKRMHDFINAIPAEQFDLSAWDMPKIFRAIPPTTPGYGARIYIPSVCADKKEFPDIFLSQLQGNQEALMIELSGFGGNTSNSEHYEMYEFSLSKSDSWRFRVACNYLISIGFMEASGDEFEAALNKLRKQ